MSATIANITYAVFTTQVKRWLYNGYASVAENVTDREIQLYFYEAAASVMVRYSEKSMQMDGVRSVQEGFITTYKFTSFAKDDTTGFYSIQLPQQPIGLPLGYSIIEPYFAKSGATSFPCFFLTAHQRAYNQRIPSPNFGFYVFVENSTLFIDARGANPNSAGTLYVPMLSTRSSTGNDTDVINLTDDAMSQVFDIVTAKLTERLHLFNKTKN